VLDAHVEQTGAYIGELLPLAMLVEESPAGAWVLRQHAQINIPM
jgi:hypothetical protein